MDGIETAKDSSDDSDVNLKTENYSVLTDEDGETAEVNRFRAAASRTSEKYSSIDKNSAAKLEYCRVQNQNDIVTVPASDDETSDESMNLVQEREKHTVSNTSVQTATSSKYTMEKTQESVSVYSYDKTNRQVKNSGTPTKFSYADVLKSSPTKEKHTPRKDKSTASHEAALILEASTSHDFHEDDDTDKEDVANTTDVSGFNSSQEFKQIHRNNSFFRDILAFHFKILSGFFSYQSLICLFESGYVWISGTHPDLDRKI